MNHKIIWFALLCPIYFVLVMAGCSGQGSAPAVKLTEPANPPPGKPIKIGLLVDTVGLAAIYSPMIENGFRLGLEYATQGSNKIGDRPFEVIVRDVAGKPDVGVARARELIENEGVDFLVGVPHSGVALAVAEVAKVSKKIFIAAVAATPDLTGKNFNEYVFRTGSTSDQVTLTMGASLTRLGKKFIQIAPDYAYGYGMAASYYGVLKAHSAAFVVNDSTEKSGAIFIPPDTTDFTPYLQQVLDSKAEVLVVTWAGNWVPLYQQMQQLGVLKAMTVASGFGDNKTLSTVYGDAVGLDILGMVGVTAYHYTLPKNPVNDWLIRKHQEKFKEPPDMVTPTGFTAAQMVVEGLRKTNGDARAEKLIPIFEGMEFPSLKGVFKVRKYDHVALQTLYLAKLANITDPDYKFFELVQEFPPEETAPPCALEGEYKSRCP